MDETAFFVPVVESKGALYRLEVIDSQEGPWMICGVVDGKFKSKMLACFENRQTEPPPIAFTLYREGDRAPFMEKLTPNTQSVFLGLFLQAHRYIRRLRFRDGWGSITVTGDLDPHDGRVDLVAVGDIATKYEGVLVYAKDRPGERHLFVYVGGEALELPDAPDNLEVKAFRAEESLGEVLAFLFEPCFDGEQKRLFDCANESLNRPAAYVPTKAFEEIREKAHLPDWKGCLIHGEGESGKSAMALELAYWLTEREYIYAPIWIKIDNTALQGFIGTYQIPPSTTQERFNPIQIDPVAAYLTLKIAARFELPNWRPEDGLQVLRMAMTKHKRRYLLVIDNLECPLVDSILKSIKSIITGCEPQPATIITSRLAKKTAAFDGDEIALAVVRPSSLSINEIDSLVSNIIKGQEYELKLTAWNGKDEYLVFIKQIHKHFASLPGVITQVIPLLRDMTLPELQPLLLSLDELSLGQDGIHAKCVRIYHAVFLALDLFTQAVLFAFIDTAIPDSVYGITSSDGSALKKGDEPEKLTKALIADKINSRVWFKEGEKKLTKLQLKEKIPKALRELNLRHLIYQTSEFTAKTSYSIKSLPYIIFMFDPAFAGNALPSGESMRDLILNPIRMVNMALVLSQPTSLLKALMEKVKARSEEINDDECTISKLGCLHTAAAYSSIPEHIELLLMYDPDINQRDEDRGGCTPLHFAAVRNPYVGVLEALLDNGADLNIRNNRGETPLHCAARSNPNPEIVKELITRHADVNVKAVNGMTPLHRAIFTTRREVIVMLLDSGADVNIADNKGQTPFSYAAEFQEINIIKLLIEHGAAITVIDDRGRTILHHAVEYNDIALVKMLLDYGLNIHAADAAGLTPLHWAVSYGEPERIAMLLEYGAQSDINVQDKKGKTPLHTAVFNVDPAVAALLIKNGANIHTKTINGETPLHTAAREENSFYAIEILGKDPGTDVLKVLLENGAGADIQAVTTDNVRTPLHIAALENEHSHAAITLIETGADINVKDKAGISALYYLKQRTDWPIIEAAIKNLRMEPAPEGCFYPGIKRSAPEGRRQSTARSFDTISSTSSISPL
jgi:ankyrin repeat protein